MSKPILEIQHIGKKYRIQQSQQPYISLRDSIGQWFKPKSQSQDFWALNDVSFTVNAGDTIGIIGKNGAGKSTLLKILSRITPPTTGKVISRGRIASLLEVGTGFHPELSGRENVFMNGSILGMRRAEIKTHFDAIVDFAGVAQFIDTPLKHYSSGMQLRLAFAVAAFLQNEILIIDEVLAVGDAEFQKKCLGKMDEVSKSGRTVLFVSHNMPSIEKLCKRTIFLSNATVYKDGSTQLILNYYFSESYNLLQKERLINRHDRSGSQQLKFSDFKIFNQSKTISANFMQGDNVIIELTYIIQDLSYDFTGCHFSINMIDHNANLIFCHQNLIVNAPFTNKQIISCNKVVFEMKNIPFKTGEYFFHIDCVSNNNFIDYVEYAGKINVLQGNIYNYTSPFINGMLAIDAQWKINNE